MKKLGIFIVLAAFYAVGAGANGVERVARSGNPYNLKCSGIGKYAAVAQTATLKDDGFMNRAYVLEQPGLKVSLINGASNGEVTMEIEEGSTVADYQSRLVTGGLNRGVKYATADAHLNIEFVMCEP